MIALPHFTLAALLAASNVALPPPSSDERAGERFFSRAERAFFVPEGTETLTFGSVSLDVTPQVSLLRRAALAPVALEARGGDVIVWGCIDYGCAIKNELRVPANTRVVVDLPVWGQSVHLKARAAVSAGTQELMCCRGPDRAVNAVLVAGAPARVSVHGLGQQEGLAFSGVGRLLNERPALLASVDAVLVLDEMAAPDRDAQERFVKRGGTWITLTEAPGDVVVDSITHVGAGRTIALRGPLDVGQVARALATHASHLMAAPFASYTPTHQLVLNAASVALAKAPPAPLVLLVLLAAFAVAALSMWRARAGDWRGALARSAVAFGVAGLAIAVAKPLFVPREVRTRVVAWLGAGGATEVGVDAARPRSGTAPVHLEARGAVLGAATLSPHAAHVVVHIPAGAQEATVEASAEGGAALACLRPNPDAGRLRVVGTALENGLSEPIAFWARQDGAYVGVDVPPGGRADYQLSGQRPNAWDSFAQYGVRPHEERLMREVLDLCRQDSGDACGAALVRRPQETLVVEVRGW